MKDHRGMTGTALLLAAIIATGTGCSAGPAGGQTSVARRDSAARDSGAWLAGQWRGQLTVDEGETAELIVDIDRLGGRWTGQFDLLSLGVEDYPVDVTLKDQSVTLHLTAARLDFVAQLGPSDVLAGMAESGGQRDSLVLRRVGEAQFSEEFLRLETLADDSTRVESLSADAGELRRRFNEDRPFARLLMLLSPT